MSNIFLTAALFTACATSYAADPFTGKWRYNPQKGAGGTSWVEIEKAENGIRWRSESGMEFMATFDGKEHPVKGSDTVDTVALRRIDDSTFEQFRTGNPSAPAPRKHAPRAGRDRPAALAQSRSSDTVILVL